MLRRDCITLTLLVDAAGPQAWSGAVLSECAALAGRLGSKQVLWFDDPLAPAEEVHGMAALCSEAGFDVGRAVTSPGTLGNVTADVPRAGIATLGVDAATANDMREIAARPFATFEIRYAPWAVSALEELLEAGLPEGPAYVLRPDPELPWDGAEAAFAGHVLAAAAPIGGGHGGNVLGLLGPPRGVSDVAVTWSGEAFGALEVAFCAEPGPWRLGTVLDPEGVVRRRAQLADRVLARFRAKAHCAACALFGRCPVADPGLSLRLHGSPTAIDPSICYLAQRTAAACDGLSPALQQALEASPASPTLSAPVIIEAPAEPNSTGRFHVQGGGAKVEV